MKIHPILGGKHPHPNWRVGGLPCPINLHSTGAVGAINMKRLNHVSPIIDRCIEFVNDVYIPNVKVISVHKSWLYGSGLSDKSVMVYGDIPENANDFSAEQLRLLQGAIINGNLNEVLDVDSSDPEQVQEYIDLSWYDDGEADRGLHPWDGVASPKFYLGPNAGALIPTARESTRPRSPRGSGRRVGRATQWRWGHWPPRAWA